MIEALRLPTSGLEYDIATNLVASLAAAVITYVAVAVFKFRIPSLGRILFWRKFVKNFAIVVSEVPVPYDPDVKRGEQPPLTPIGDALVLGEFLRLFRAELRLDPLVVSVQGYQGFDQIKHKNLLIIGGPKYNFAAQECLIELDSYLPYQFRRLRPRAPERRVDDADMKKFVGRDGLEELAQDASRDLDYGTVVMARNPYNRETRIFMLAGLSNLSTLAAFSWIQKRRALFWIRAASMGGFQGMVQCRNTGPTRVSNIHEAHLQFFKQEG